MKIFLTTLPLRLLGMLIVPVLYAQVVKADGPNPNWFSFGPQFGLRLNARFSHIGNLNSTSLGPATGGGANRTYNDGFVKVDSSGDAGGQTWNWGYQNASQVQANALIMHGSSAINGTLNQNDDPDYGFDLAFGRKLGTLLGGQWGAQVAFDFTTLSINDNQSYTGTGSLISDAYSLNGIVAPSAPFSGSFGGPGPLLGDTPTRTTTSEIIFIAGQRTLDAQIYALRLGPYYELPFGKGWSGRLGGGLALAMAYTRYSYNETIMYGGQLIGSSGSNSGVDFNAGAYLEAKLLYAFNSHVSLFAGAQYEYLGTFSRTAGNERAQLDLSATVYVLFGIQFSF